MADGSDAIADWPLLNALVNTASGATWVSLHHGGGVGIGRSIHAGQVSVADGTELAAQKIERVLTNDPAMGVLRHVDAGYDPRDRGRRRARRADPDAGAAVTAVELLAGIADVGRDPARGGYSRHAGDAAGADLREWFAEQAGRRGLDVETDRQRQRLGLVGRARPGRRVTGSHLDSVPGGGAFDGPLGVASALEAVDALRAEGFPPGRAARGRRVRRGGGRPVRRALPGLPAAHRRARRRPRPRAARPPTASPLADAMRRRGFDPAALGPDPDRLARIGPFVELHVEQGRALDGAGRVRVGDRRARAVAVPVHRPGQPRRHHRAWTSGATRCSRPRPPCWPHGGSPPPRRAPGRPSAGCSPSPAAPT